MTSIGQRTTPGYARRSLLVLSVATAIYGVLGPGPSAAYTPHGADGGTRALVNSQTYVDPAGDQNGTAPDVTTIRVSNDDVGNLEFRIVLGNRTEILPADWITIALDTDVSAATGCHLGGESGWDWRIDLFGQINLASVFRWGSDCETELVGDGVPMGFDAATKTLLLRIRIPDIGSPRSLRFAVVASDGQPPVSDATSDWIYEIVVGAPPAPRDRTRPRVKALPSKEARGGVVLLRYVVFDETGKAREEISIYRARSLIEVKHTALGRRRATTIYAKRWRVPKSVTGPLRFCVRAWDASGNPSRASCAAIALR